MFDKKENPNFLSLILAHKVENLSNQSIQILFAR